MTQKNETPATETTTTPAKPEKTPATQRAQTRTTNSASVAGDLPLEMVELVTELRGTVRRLDPRKHTEKTLRRVLSNISDILKDIEALYTQG